MGADVYITTEREANFGGLNRGLVGFMIEQASRDGSYYVYYWRDSYNLTNLAHTLSMSYWEKAFENNPIKFLERLSRASDKEIERGFEERCRRFGCNPDVKILELLKEKRNYLGRIFEAGVISVSHWV